MLVDLSEKDIDIIIYSLNETYLDSIKKLRGNDLGDLERKYIETTKERTKELIVKLGENN
jgi:hypothetical protein